MTFHLVFEPSKVALKSKGFGFATRRASLPATFSPVWSLILRGMEGNGTPIMTTERCLPPKPLTLPTARSLRDPPTPRPFIVAVPSPCTRSALDDQPRDHPHHVRLSLPTSTRTLYAGWKAAPHLWHLRYATSRMAAPALSLETLSPRAIHKRMEATCLMFLAGAHRAV